MPAAASVARASSFAGIGRVDTSATTLPRLPWAASSPTTCFSAGTEGSERMQ